MTAYIVVAFAFILASALLFVFGTNLLSFSALVLRRDTSGPPTSTHDREPAIPLVDLPQVTIQLPIYNELYVSARVIKSACAIDYPRHLLEIQVLDDSTDETTAVVADAVAEAQAAGVNIVHLHRENRDGYKAGALAAGLVAAKGDLVAIFDADFVPPQDFLTRTVGHFADEKLAFVQARWGHLNRDFSWLTRLQALAIDGHFLVEQAGRRRRGSWFNFNGTAGIWRAAAIDDAGGWKADTLTEDLDLSYRAHLRGWHAIYLEDLVVPAELPAQMSSFRRQQHRWARGSIECAVRLLPGVWRADVKPSVKFQASIHLLAYGVHLLLLLLTLIYPFVVLATVSVPGLATAFGAGYVFVIPSLAPAAFFLVGQRRAQRPLRPSLPAVVAIIVFGSGLMINTARAVLQILTRPNPEFERTAKLGLGEAQQDGTIHSSLRRYQLRGLDRIVIVEALVGLYSLGSGFLAFRHQNWGILLFAVLFGSGLLAVSAATVGQTIATRRHRRHVASGRIEGRDQAELELSPTAQR